MIELHRSILVLHLSAQYATWVWLRISLTFSCHVLFCSRIVFSLNLRTVSLWLNSCGYPGRILLSTFSSGGEVRLKYLLDSLLFFLLVCRTLILELSPFNVVSIALWLVARLSFQKLYCRLLQRGRFLSGLASFNSVQLNIPLIYTCSH